jgi:hypothetical protein
MVGASRSFARRVSFKPAVPSELAEAFIEIVVSSYPVGDE